jgi:hypothetical protein
LSPLPRPQLKPSNPIRTHVEMLHRLAAGIDGVLVVSVFHASPTGEQDRPGTVTRHPVGDVAGMLAAIEAQRDVPGANVYVGLQVMRKGLARGKRGNESDIIAVLGLVADMDGDTGKVGDLPIEPNLILETSLGNGQPFWLFERPLTPVEAKSLAVALKRATGSDHGTADVAHVWRVPGTLNWPNKKKLERGRSLDPVGVTVAQEWDGTLTSVDELRSALAPWMSESAERRVVDVGDLPTIDGIAVSSAAGELFLKMMSKTAPNMHHAWSKSWLSTAIRLKRRARCSWPLRATGLLDTKPKKGRAPISNAFGASSASLTLRHAKPALPRPKA